MDKKELLDAVKEAEKRIEAFQEELREKTQEMFAPLLVEIMKKSQVITSVSWTQYTPYFNDGEECIFSVNSDYPRINGEEVEHVECEGVTNIFSDTVWRKIRNQEELEEVVERDKESGKAENSWYKQPVIGETYAAFSNPNYIAKEEKVLEDIKEVISSIPEDTMKSIFGDHVEVTISIDGTVTTEHYDHE